MPEEFRDNIDNTAFDPSTIGSNGTAPEPNSRVRRDAQGRRLKNDGTLWPKPGGAKSSAGGGASKPAGAAKEKIRSSVDLSSLVGVFVGAHVIIAERYEVPELVMDMSEGQQLADAVQNVLRHYSIETTQKAIDWAALIGTSCMIYGSRFGAYMLRRAAEKRSGIIIPPNMPMRPAPEAKTNGSGHAPAPAQQPRFDNDAMVFNVEDLDGE